MSEVKGLPAYIYQSTHGADVFSPLKDVNQVTIVGEGIDRVFAPDEKAPAVRIVRRQLFGKEYVHAEPMKPGSYAFGGRYISGSDSRIKEISQYPIPLHDRDMSFESR